MSTAPAGTATLTQEPQQQEQQQTQPSKWYSSFDPETQGWMQNRGLVGEELTPELFSKAVQGHRNAEKIIGVPADQIIRLPKEGDVEGYRSAMAKLGMPAKPDEYKLPVPEGADPEFSKKAANWFHEAGLTQRQAEAVSGKWNEFVTQFQQESTQQSEQQIEQDVQTLRKEWGAAHDQNIQIARNAVKAFGMDAEVLGKLEAAMGYKGLMEFMHNLGNKVGEDKFVTGESALKTPASAQQSLKELGLDRDFMAAFIDGSHPGHKAAVEKRNRLIEQAYPQ
jgi:hypothetical protein